jgi:hypothetical protein
MDAIQNLKTMAGPPDAGIATLVAISVPLSSRMVFCALTSVLS